MKVTTGLLKSVKKLELLDTFCEENDDADILFTEAIIEADDRGFDFKELNYSKRWKMFNDDNDKDWELQWFDSVYISNDDFMLKLDCKNTYMKLHLYYVYILTTGNNIVLYTGVTNELRRRVFEHKSGL